MRETDMPLPTVGVLGLQGDFACHMRALEDSGVRAVEVRTAGAFDECDGLILPGGESSTMLWLLERFNMREALEKYVTIYPVWGTCAGLILLAKKVVGSPDSRGVKIRPLGALDVDVARNAYGRQVHSFEEIVEVNDGNEKFTCPATFIRAPRIVRVGSGVSVLAERNGEPILVRAGNALASSFHTELHDDTSLTRYFVEQMVRPTLSGVSRVSGISADTGDATNEEGARVA